VSGTGRPISRQPPSTSDTMFPDSHELPSLESERAMFCGGRVGAEYGDARAWHDLRLQGFSAGGFALYVLFLVNFPPAC